MMYKMRLVFSLDVSKHELNKLMDSLGEPRPIFNGLIESALTQTLDRVPTKAMIDAYADAIAKAYENEECHVEKVKFLRYDFIYPVDDDASPKESDTALTEDEIDNIPIGKGVRIKGKGYEYDALVVGHVSNGKWRLISCYGASVQPMMKNYGKTWSVLKIN